VSARAIAKVILVAAAVAAALYLLYLLRRIIGMIAISLFIAIALGPLVARYERYLRGRRALAILATYLTILLAVVVVGLAVVPPIVSQTNKFVKNVPNYISDIQKNKTIRNYDRRYHVTQKLKEQAAKLPSKLGSAAGALRSVTVGVFSALVELVTVLVLTFFFLLDGKRMTEFVLDQAGPARGERWRRIADDVYRSVGGYVAGNFAISFIAGFTTWVTLALLGVQFAVPLAVLMAFFDLIPLVGATIAGVLIGIVCAIDNFPTAVIVWVIVLIVYQQIENNVLQPVIYRRTVALHPLVVLVSVLIGAELLGVLGALLAIPVGGALQIVIKDWWRQRRKRPSPIATQVAGGGDLPETAPG
jgi:predicted PurR-regulated permease PerM